jgi:hypothetical protein
MRHLKTLLPFLLATIMLVGIADAGPRGRRLFRWPLIPAVPQAHPHTRHEPRNPQPYWNMNPELYPQWYGGFHGRMIQNYGIPPGDVGIRGQAW